MMTFVQLRQVFEDFIAHVQQRGDYVVEDVWPDTTGGLAVWAFKGERTLSLVKLLAMSGSERTMLEIAGGGAAGLPHAPEVYEYVATTMYDFGALWANRMPDGTVTVGSRVTIPSDVLDHNSDDIGYVMGMLGLMGTMGEIAAAHLLPRVGGVRFDGVSPGSPDALDLLTTLVGPPPG